jgi:hypothetical protein
MPTEILLRKSGGKDHRKDLSVDERIILKWILNSSVGRVY